MPSKKQTGTQETTAPVKAKAPAKAKTATAASTPADAAPVAEKAAAPKAKTAAPKTAAPKAAAPKAADAPAKKAPAAKASAAAKKPAASSAPTKVYGEIHASGSDLYIHKGSVADGQLKLVIDSGKGDLLSRMPAYHGQFVTIVGEFAKKKKANDSASFVLHTIASHDQIAGRAYELSHQNPAAVEENWLKAENELLQM
jgi:type IV secretory pathway VirB10-like protein